MSELERKTPVSLSGLLKELQTDGIRTNPPEQIMKQLGEVGNAIVTRDFGCGIRILREGTKKHGFRYLVGTTNDLENPDHPLSKKYRLREVVLD